MRKRLGPTPLILPMPALLVGTYDEAHTPNAMAAAWTAVCCKKPLYVGVAIRESRHTFTNLQRKQAFTLAVPPATLATEVDYLGIVSGAKVPEKLAIAELNSEKAIAVDAPILVDCPVNLECRLDRCIPLGTHNWCIGEVLEVQVNEELVSESGALDVDKLNPIVYAISNAEYRTIGKVVGNAFRDGKKLIQKDD